MEDTLGGYLGTPMFKPKDSLNPCFNGRYSRRKKKLQL